MTGNTANNRGGGIFTLSFGGMETRIENSQITNNHVSNVTATNLRNGGGIYAYIWNYQGTQATPKFTITGSTIDNNDAYQDGGGIFVCAKVNGEFVATNSTVSGNRTTNSVAGAGGGIFIAHYTNPTESVDAYLRNLTITQNQSVSGGGVQMINLDNVRVRVDNSIVSQNFSDIAKTTPNNLVGRLDIANTQYNLVGSGSTILDLSGAPASLDSTNKTNNDTPHLGPLQNNGGPTPTHALFSNSAAVDAGSNSYAADPLTTIAFTTDQRGAGFPRIVDFPGVHDPGNIVDMGAYELIAPPTLLGDYNRNGVVDMADYVLWRHTLGQSVTAYSGADGNGNGIIDQPDYDVWRANFGNTFPGAGNGTSAASGNTAAIATHSNLATANKDLRLKAQLAVDVAVLDFQTNLTRVNRVFPRGDCASNQNEGLLKLISLLSQPDVHRNDSSDMDTDVTQRVPDNAVDVAVSTIAHFPRIPTEFS